MCLFSANNKKGRSGCVGDASGDRTKVGNNVSDTTFVWLCPESSALAHSHPQPAPRPAFADLQQPTLIRVSAADSDS